MDLIFVIVAVGSLSNRTEDDGGTSSEALFNDPIRCSGTAFVSEESEIIRNATEKTLAKGVRTKDIGGQATSETVTDSIIDEISDASN